MFSNALLFLAGRTGYLCLRVGMSIHSLLQIKAEVVIHKNEKSSFVCQQCGTCCRWEGHVLLTPEDITRLSVSTELSEEKFIERYTVLAANRRQLSLSEHPDGRCVFLEEDGCRHYADRPAQCRAFPVGWHDTSGCPAMESVSHVRNLSCQRREKD